MRLRRSNQGKSFRPSDLNLRLGLSDEDDEAVSQGNGESRDEGFVVDDDGSELDAEDVMDEDLAESSGPESLVKGVQRPKAKKPNNHQAPEQQAPARSFGIVQEYPTDLASKWTRSYAGPVKRWTRLQLLTKFWFGDRENYLTIVGDFVRLWWGYEILPPKLTSKYDLAVASNPWMPNGFPEDQELKLRQWYERYLEKRARRSLSSPIDKGKAFRRFIPQPPDALTVIIGDAAEQKEHHFKQGQGVAFSGLGNLIEKSDSEKTRSSGWLLDVGGIVVSMGWAPSESRTEQLLAMAVIPFRDQAFYQDLKKAPQESEKREGAIQIWRFEAEELQDSMAVLAAPKEHTVQISCFTWVNMNRIAVGHTDGTIALWSIHPCQILQRHPVHLSPIIDMASGYPSHPFIVATIPMGGIYTLTDLNRPNQEMSYNANLSVCTQPNLLSWSEVLRGYVLLWPSAFAGNSAIAFEHARVFAQARYLMSLDSQPTCLSIGRCHPCVLVGTTDGSLWAVNIMKKAYSHREASSKLRLFRHEYRAAPVNPGGGGGGGRDGESAREGEEKEERGNEMPRGKCRVLHGFLPERNLHPKGTRPQKAGGGAKASSGKKKNNSKNSAKGKGKSKAGGSEEEEEDDDLSDAMGQLDDAEGEGAVPQPITVHDPQARITHVVWSPNVRFSWWAAAAMGSGLVRVMDLGVDPPPRTTRGGDGGMSSSEDEEGSEGDGEEGNEGEGGGDDDEEEDGDGVKVEADDGRGEGGDLDTDSDEEPRTRARWRPANK
ncbi:hypothetical protein SLS62_005238 [Diatrype stigma]|uniref:Uncharacterized protein n=1 Tax=Diatrype stigma TaxID=117547 RepID=A0AAN9YS90_9PEZI